MTSRKFWLFDPLNAMSFFFFLHVALIGPRSVAIRRLHPCSHWPLFAIAPTHECYPFDLCYSKCRFPTDRISTLRVDFTRLDTNLQCLFCFRSFVFMSGDLTGLCLYIKPSHKTYSLNFAGTIASPFSTHSKLTFPSVWPDSSTFLKSWGALD